VQCLQRALCTSPLAIGYAVWTGIGLLGAALLGMIFFDEPANTLRLVFLLTLTLTLALVGWGCVMWRRRSNWRAVKKLGAESIVWSYLL
tara:strand:+ start:94 stop:360 length:267 start_codon:yes stop_codon:yes gene_type:complete